MVENETAIRQLLIDSCHSSSAAKEFFVSHLADSEVLAQLVKIAKDAEDWGGDAPMQAAYWASRYPSELLAQHEAALLEMLPIIDGYGGHVALALGKIRSQQSRAAILKELGDGSRFDAWLFQKALEAVDSAR